MFARKAAHASIPHAAAQQPKPRMVHSLDTSILLHLLPGVALLAAFWLIWPLVHRAGFPMTVAGALTIPLVLAPLELGIILWAGWRHRGHWSFTAMLDYREPIARWQYLLLVPLLVVWFLEASSFWRSFEPTLARSLASFPRWLIDPLPAPSAVVPSHAVLWTTVVLSVICSGIIAPIVEEVYFRGFLLPRIEHLGQWAIVLNATLFACQHLWTPLSNPGRILAWLPIVYVARRKRNFYLSLGVHLITNMLGVLGPVAALLSRT